MWKFVNFIFILIICEFDYLPKSLGVPIFGNYIQDVFRKEYHSLPYIMKEVNKNGYRIEEHNVTTADGYKLKLHRILSNRNIQANCQINLPPVYLFHGLLNNADTWIINGRNSSLPYILSDAGYDVWLGNARGTTHSRAHTNLNPRSHRFWEFTWHEIGIYDNPANIEYILTTTGSKQLHYVGHSQGTTSFFVMTSLIPEFNAKIKSMHALSPVAFMKYERSPFFTLPARYYNLITLAIKKLGLTEILPNTLFTEFFQKLFCSQPNLRMNFCYQLISNGGGFNEKQSNVSVIYKIFDVAPAGASIYQILHYAQGVLTGKFQTFDSGNIRENIRRYGNSKPIQYPLNKITAPLYFHVSGNDPIAPLEDIELLIKGLPKKPTYIPVPDPKWNHFDYITGNNVKNLVYNRVLNDIQSWDKINCHLT